LDWSFFWEEQETEVYGCGRNLRGQLGIGVLRHIVDIHKLEQLSNFTIDTEEQKNMKVALKKISCGLNHCMALLNIGVIMEWGDNEKGQLGNKKRSFSENPVILSSFTDEKVLNLSCGQTSSAVIVEDKF
jgi:alpha-tubulin suppressor-like RCC1 family protein